MSNVSFANDIEAVEPKEQAIPPANNQNGDMTNLRRSLATGSMAVGALSKSAKAWDLDGDGELDEAELALKALDKEGKGVLTKEEMYALMQESLDTQRDLFKMKKIAGALAVVTCILALSNLGTSFVAAMLSKDTATSGATLVDTHTGQVIQTDNHSIQYKPDAKATNEFNRQRRLACVESQGTDGHADLDCSFSTNLISADFAKLMLKQCHDNQDVHFEYPDINTGIMTDLHICPTDEGEFIHVEEVDGTVISGTVIHNDHHFMFEPNPEDPTHYLITVNHIHAGEE